MKRPQWLDKIISPGVTHEPGPHYRVFLFQVEHALEHRKPLILLGLRRFVSCSRSGTVYFRNMNNPGMKYF